MNVCLHCGRPCAEEAAFCDECQARRDKNPFFATVDAVTSGNLAQISTLSSPLERADQTVSRLNEAARRIEEEEPGNRHLRRSIRLAPLRDISSEIQRASTPHPSIVERQPTFETQPEVDLKLPRQQHWSTHTSGVDMPRPDLWLKTTPDEESEADLWANATDPFVSRARPSTTTGTAIEAADIQRVQIEEHPTMPYASLQPQARRRRFSIWHLALATMVIMALLALGIDGLLLVFSLHHNTHPTIASGGPPTLTLSATTASAGDSVSLYLTNFGANTKVALTHDFQQALFTDTTANRLTIGANGQADTLFTVNSSWGPGFHLIVAEDITTRDTASAILQVEGAGPSRPPHLLLDTTLLKLGNSVQGTNTIQTLALRNSGSSTISWSVSSDQPWLLVAPQQGTFDAGQTILVAAQRSHIAPGDYKGTLTFSSSVGASEQVPVQMTVDALPPDSGPMISLAPPLLSFTGSDGSTAPQTQVINLSNPGQEPLYWSLSQGSSVATTMQSDLLQNSGQQNGVLGTGTPGNDESWLNADQSTGVLAPGKSTQLRVTVRSQNLLPGTYTGMLLFNASEGKKAFDSPQELGVALTIQPHCGLITSTGSLSFTAVEGQSNPSSHTLNLSATNSCANEPLNWQALPSGSWITVSPASGQIKGTGNNVTSIGVNTANLVAGKKYSGTVTFQAGQNTQTLMVNLDLQRRPPSTEPIMGASPLTLNFSNIQGQANPSQQVITITNNGGSPLKWHTSVPIQDQTWMATSPTVGTVQPGQTGQLAVNLITKNLTPGTYSGLVMIDGTNTTGSPASGSPQTITVNLVVQPPCTLVPPSASSLLFNGLANGTNPLPQTVTFTTTGSCSWPLHWSTTLAQPASWLTLGPASGTSGSSSQQGSIAVGANLAGLQPNTYNAQVTINAVDSTGTAVLGSGQTFTVTLTVLQPCTLKPLPSTFNFNTPPGQATGSQTLSLSETGSCSGGVSWTLTGDSGSSNWLKLSATSGTDSGSGSDIGITADATNLAPGNYSGQLTIAANNKGMVLQGSPQTITVNLTVSNYAVSGSALACDTADCSTSEALPNATVTLTSNSTTIATTTADASGNFTFTNIPAGSYTLTVTGSANGSSYSGTITVTISGNTNSVNVQTFSS